MQGGREQPRQDKRGRTGRASPGRGSCASVYTCPSPRPNPRCPQARCCCTGTMSEKTTTKCNIRSPSAKGAMRRRTLTTRTIDAVQRWVLGARLDRVGVSTNRILIFSTDDRANLRPGRPTWPKGCTRRRCAPALQECFQWRQPRQDADQEEYTEFMAKETEWGGWRPQADREDGWPGLQGLRRRSRSSKPLHHRDETDSRVQSKTTRMSTTSHNRCHQQDLRPRSVSPTSRENRRSYQTWRTRTGTTITSP